MVLPRARNCCLEGWGRNRLISSAKRRRKALRLETQHLACNNGRGMQPPAALRSGFPQINERSGDPSSVRISRPVYAVKQILGRLQAGLTVQGLQNARLPTKRPCPPDSSPSAIAPARGLRRMSAGARSRDGYQGSCIRQQVSGLCCTLDVGLKALRFPP